ncbi:MAG: hypothetical protein U0997_06665 [Sulfurimicrobium sp.]|nr:hypothetical protein [Sulfurimicrobium sp.]
MPAANKDILRDHGATTPWRMVYRQGKNLPPVNLSGCAAVFLLNDRAGATEVTLTTVNGGITLGTTGGEISVNLTHAGYAALAPGEYSYRLGVTFTGGELRYLVRGKWTIR